METRGESQVRALEKKGQIPRYEVLKKLGRELFGESGVGKEGVILERDVDIAREFLGKAAQETNPQVLASFWEHVLLAPELGKRLGEAAKDKGIKVEPKEAEFLLWLHELGRIVTPGAYLRNDLIVDRLLFKIGIGKEIREELLSVRSLLREAEKLNLNEEQLRQEESLNLTQEEAIRTYFESLTPAQRIINFADNLGKRSEKGPFDLENFLDYLRTQEARYEQESPWFSVAWAIPKRQAGAALQAFIIERTAKWLEDLGINFADIRQDLRDWGPRFVIIVRHGELDNPRGIVYSRDEVMRSEDIMHLSLEGEEQMEILAKLIKERGFRCVEIAQSPQIRSQEATTILNQILGMIAVVEDKNLDDGYSPGPYKEGMTMKQLAEIGGNVYDKLRWGEYHHENPEEIIKRMESSFWSLAGKLEAGKTGILVSHGDPIAWLVNKLATGKVPEPADLRKMIYPPKGGAVLAVIDPEGKLFTLYSLTETDPNKIY